MVLLSGISYVDCRWGLSRVTVSRRRRCVFGFVRFPLVVRFPCCFATSASLYIYYILYIRLGTRVAWTVGGVWCLMVGIETAVYGRHVWGLCCGGGVRSNSQSDTRHRRKRRSEGRFGRTFCRKWPRTLVDC